MPSKPNSKYISGDDNADSFETESEITEDSSLGDDKKKRSYYYDDACGYEVYDPENDTDDAEIKK